MFEKYFLDFLEGPIPFDINAFNTFCIQNGKRVMDLGEFASKAGMYMIAKTVSPHDIEGWLFKSMRGGASLDAVPPKKDCGSCGGGQVR